MLPRTYSLPRAALTVVVSLVLGVLLLQQVEQPIHRAFSTRFTARGDDFLVAQEYTAAAREYSSALRYDPHNPTAQAHRDLALAAPTDIAVAATFYEEHNVVAVTGRLAKAQAVFPIPKAALQAGVDFYSQGEYVYAQYPLRQAVMMDPNYPEAWHYLGLTYQQLAKLNPSFTAKANQAFATRDTLTPKYIQ